MNRFRFLPIFIILLLITACIPSEARPTSIPTVLTNTPEATAVPTETAQPTRTPLPTATPLPEVTAVPTRYIGPTPTPTFTPTPIYPLLPSENSLTLTVQNHWGGVPQAVLVDGSTAYLAVGPRLVAVDVTDPTAPLFLGQSPPASDVLYDIVQIGTLVYGAAGQAGLVVLDVTNPANIQLVDAGPGYSGANPPYAQAIDSSNGRLFVTNLGVRTEAFTRPVDLLWFDLTTPTTPTFAGSMPLKDAEGFSATDDLLFIATESGVQIADPREPTQELSRIGNAEDVFRVKTAVHNNHLFLLYLGSEPRIFLYDVTDPAAPEAIPQSQLFSPAFFSLATGNDNTLATSFGHGEFGYCFSQITLVDIAQPEAPQKTAEFDPQNCISDMVGSGELLYVTGLSGLQIYSTSDPANVQLLGSYTNPVGFQTIEDILPGQPTSYLLTNEGRGSTIVSLDLNQPTPVLLGQTEPYTGSQPLQLLETGQTLAATIWNSSMLLFDSSDPTNLTPLYEPVEEGEALGSLHGAALVDNFLYMPLQNQYMFSGNLGVFDLQDPSNPQLVNTVQTGLQTFDTMVLGDGYLYLLEGYEQLNLAIVDIHQPLEPRLVSNLALPDDASHLAVVDNVLYALCSGDRCNSLTVIDVADGERPSIINQWQLPFTVADTLTVGQQIYVLADDNTLRVLDASQPDQPTVIGLLDLPGWYGRLTAANNTLYVSASMAGLFMVTTPP
ncbi:MAG: hypothetical protein IPM53_13590 [Anaerolineaceae bacterium]|nr:hypothetical protein [Anaerolineaceae bacterium]